MRSELKVLIYSNVVIFLFATYMTFGLIMLVCDSVTSEALTDSEINPPHNIPQSPLLIPKIIHQTYKDENIPDHWKAGQKRCIDLHEDYEYILWTDAMIMDFMTEHYSWFLPTFNSYPFPIERADAVRYFILYHYGGVYIDLDDGCERRLDPLLTVPAFVRKTSPVGVSNDVMGAIPHHPFYLHLMNNLKNYKRNWFVPYVTIIASTGPLFVSLVWKKYKRTKDFQSFIVRTMQPHDYKMHPSSFFSISKGSSWHTEDAKSFMILATHLLACVVAGFVLAFTLLYFEFYIYCCLCSRTDDKTHLHLHDIDESNTNPSSNNNNNTAIDEESLINSNHDSNMIINTFRYFKNHFLWGSRRNNNSSLGSTNPSRPTNHSSLDFRLSTPISPYMDIAYTSSTSDFRNNEFYERNNES